MAERWSGEVDVVANEVPEPVRGEHGRWVKGTPAPNPSPW
jgi:hypothetical protein